MLSTRVVQVVAVRGSFVRLCKGSVRKANANFESWVLDLPLLLTSLLHVSVYIEHTINRPRFLDQFMYMMHLSCSCFRCTYLLTVCQQVTFLPGFSTISCSTIKTIPYNDLLLRREPASASIPDCANTHVPSNAHFNSGPAFTYMCGVVSLPEIGRAHV